MKQRGRKKKKWDEIGLIIGYKRGCYDTMANDRSSSLKPSARTLAVWVTVALFATLGLVWVVRVELSETGNQPFDQHFIADLHQRPEPVDLALPASLARIPASELRILPVSVAWGRSVRACQAISAQCNLNPSWVRRNSSQSRIFYRMKDAKKPRFTVSYPNFDKVLSYAQLIRDLKKNRTSYELERTVLLLTDAFDVFMQADSTEREMIDEFVRSQIGFDQSRVVFNSENHVWPPEVRDLIEERMKRMWLRHGVDVNSAGLSRYLNAGCMMGLVSDIDRLVRIQIEICRNPERYPAMWIQPTSKHPRRFRWRSEQGMYQSLLLLRHSEMAELPDSLFEGLQRRPDDGVIEELITVDWQNRLFQLSSYQLDWEAPSNALRWILNHHTTPVLWNEPLKRKAPIAHFPGSARSFRREVSFYLQRKFDFALLREANEEDGCGVWSGSDLSRLEWKTAQSFCEYTLWHSFSDLFKIH